MNVVEYDAKFGDRDVFVIDGDEPGECARWIAAENPAEVRR